MFEGLLEKHQYRLVGRLVALSLIHEGPGLHCLNEELFRLMAGENVDLQDVHLFLPDEMTDLIRHIEDANNEENKQKFLEDNAEKLIDQGITNPQAMLQDRKGEMVHILKKNYIYYRVSSEISQFKDGMNDVGKSWDFIHGHAKTFQTLFCHVQKSLSVDDISSLFSVKFSDEGTNNRRTEDVTVYAWEMFLQSIEDGELPVTFSQLLAFATGADQIPPCGFPKKVEILFYDQLEGCRLPYVSTCGLQMWLPRMSEPDSLSSLLVRAITESCGFLKV